MALDDDIRVLSGVRLFQGFTHEQLRLMAFGAETVTLAAGKKLYAEGAPADCAFVIVSGDIGLYRLQNGKRERVSTESDGAILGEFALIAESQRLLEAIAERETKLLRLSRSMFRRILEEFPDTAAILHRRISANLQSMLAQIEAVANRLQR